MDFYRRLGSRLRALRVQAGLSQARLGARLGVTAGAINRYESGGRRIPLSDVPRIAGVLGVPPAALLGLREGARTARGPQTVRETSPTYRLSRSRGTQDASAYARSLSPARLRALAARAGLAAASDAALRRYAALIAGDYAAREGARSRRHGRG
jgi:transcriptional regulator with XRE-family HTH domain